jgi:hypothetical protein
MAELHSSIVALVSLASGIASNHPAMGQCQLSKLRGMGITEDQIATVVEIARHIRDEAAQRIDNTFDEKSEISMSPSNINNIHDGALPPIKLEISDNCCSNTVSGQSCC